MKSTKTLLAIGTSLALVLLPSVALAQPVEPKPAGDASPMLVVDTPHFLAQVMSANQFEIDSSELAKKKAKDEDVNALADMIIADHTAAGQKLETLLADHPAKPAEPAGLSPKHEKMLSQLEAAEGADFRTLYIDMQAQAHVEAIGLFRAYAGSGDDPILVGFAKETLPALETHAAHVKAMAMGEHK